MNTFSNKIFYVCCGAIIGASTAWILAEKKYKDQLEKEITDVREAYNNKAKKIAELNETRKESISLETVEPNEEVIDISEQEKEDVDALIDNYVSTSIDSIILANQSKVVEPTNVEVQEPATPDYEPEIIDISEFGEEMGYNQITLYYYVNNKIFTDDKDEKVESAELLIGTAAIDKLDTDPYINELYVKDEQRFVYYEILIDEQDYDLEH